MQDMGATIAPIHGANLVSTVQLQFDGHPDQAATVAAWFLDQYPHLACECDSQPGLTVTLQLPNGPYDGKYGWPARLMQATGPLDLAFDMLIECFDRLELGPVGVVSVHLTGLLVERLDHPELD